MNSREHTHFSWPILIRAERRWQVANLEISTSEGTTVVVQEAAVDEFKTKFRGQVLDGADPGYDELRMIWNSMIDHRPALIARCIGVADVIDAVKFARNHGLLVSVRGGGHNVSGNAVTDGGLMIDLSQMTSIHVDPHEGTARAEAGALLRDLDRETQTFGLAVPAGTVSETGIAGLTLGGGIGWLMRKHGLTCDNLIAADLITADGKAVTASETDNTDLLWGLRGGGGNFGIVTSFKYRAHRVGPTVLAGFILHPLEQATEFLRFLREFLEDVPDELTTIPFLRILPPVPAVPAELRDTRFVGIAACYSGDIEQGEAVLRPLRDFGSPVLDSISPMPFVAHQTIFDDGAPSGQHHYEKSEFLADLNDDAIETLVAHGETISSPYSFVGLFQLGGAVSRVSEGDTAYTHRDAAFSLIIGSGWEDSGKTEEYIEWTRTFWKAMQRFSTGGVYVNFLSHDDGEDRVKSAYGAEKYERLADLKNKYDPTNFFRLNQNIKPAVQPSVGHT